MEDFGFHLLDLDFLGHVPVHHKASDDVLTILHRSRRLVKQPLPWRLLGDGIFHCLTAGLEKQSSFQPELLELLFKPPGKRVRRDILQLEPLAKLQFDVESEAHGL